MTRGPAKAFEQLCKFRGVSLRDAEPCVVERHDDGTITVDETHPAYPKGPSLMSKAASLAVAAAKHAAAGMPRASDEEADRRFAICQSCDHYDKDTKSCRLCGCFIAERRGKLAWADQKCPVNKW